MWLGQKLWSLLSQQMAGLSFSTTVSVQQVSLDFDTHFRRRTATAIKCNVVNWDDQLSLFELAFEQYGAVDIVVRMLLSTASPLRLRVACSTNERQISDAGITESAKGTCMGDLNVVDGKPVVPKLATLEVNLIGVFYSQ